MAFSLILLQNRWTRREEADFYRVVSTFGVVFDPDRGQFDWTKFRAMARLHKKTDDSLEKYLYAFMSMCRRVCRLPSKEGIYKLCFSLVRQRSKITKIQKFSTLISVLFNSTCQHFFRIINYA